MNIFFNISLKFLRSRCDLQSNFSCECRMTHEILKVFTSISEAALKVFFFGEFTTDTFKTSNQPWLFRHFTTPESPQSSISLYSACQRDTTRPLQSSSSNTRVCEGSSACDRKRISVLADAQLHVEEESGVMFFSRIL